MPWLPVLRGFPFLRSLSRGASGAPAARAVAVAALLVIAGLCSGGWGGLVRIVAAAPAAPAVAVAAAADGSGAHSVIEDSIAKFYFADDSSVLPPDAHAALKAVVKEVAVGQQVVIATYGAPGAPGSGQSARRAARLRDALKGLGLPPDKVELRAPAPGPARPDAQWARRVDVMVVD